MTHQDYSAAFSGLYLAPGYYMGGDREAYRAYLAHLKALLHPSSIDEFRLIGRWATLQWRLQCLHTTERDWWESYEQASDAMNPVGEASMLDVDPFEQLAVGFKMIRSWDTMVRLEARLMRQEGKLLPLIEAMLERAEESSQASAPTSPQTIDFSLAQGGSMPSQIHVGRSSGDAIARLSGGFPPPVPRLRGSHPLVSPAGRYAPDPVNKGE